MSENYIQPLCTLMSFLDNKEYKTIDDEVYTQARDFFLVERVKWNDYEPNYLLYFEAVDNIPGSTAEFKDLAPNNSTQLPSKSDSGICFTHPARRHWSHESINKFAKRTGNTRVPIRQSLEVSPSRLSFNQSDVALIRRARRNSITVHLTINNR
jgi:hypothetical protein